ncbi:MAG: hypothetical protein J6W80_01475 [Kiritimatiellae bacterium]|nr:hypothetical protein [Kiritimatiellia bacterium]
MTFTLDKFLKFLPAAMFAMVCEFLMNLVDSAVCGHVLGEDALAAVNLMQPVLCLVEFLALLVGTGTSVLFAVESGRFDRRRASEYLTQGLWSALMVGGAALVALAVFREKAAEAFGVHGAVLEGVKEYWLWFLPCVVVEPVAFYLSCVCYADGDEKICILAYAVQLAANFAVSCALTMRLGIAGCAIGTAVGHILAISVLAFHFRKKTNSLRFAKHFSFADTLRICKCSMGEASSRLAQAALMLALNLYIVSRLGAEMLPVLAVVVAVLELAAVFDGVPRAMQPLASVYIGEKNDRLAMRILRYATAGSLATGILATVLLAVFPQIATAIVGMGDSALAAEAHKAVRIVSAGLAGTAVVALFNMYWTCLGKETLALALTAGAMLFAPLLLFPALGEMFGANGVWMAMALAPYAALGATAAFIAVKWGRKALPHFLSSERARKMRVYDTIVDEAAVCALSRKINRFLAVRRNLGGRKASIAALLAEETLLLVKDHNPGRRIRAEVTLDFSAKDTLYVTIRDDGEIFDITDADAKVSSLRSYLVSNLMENLPGRRNLTTTGFNRNAFKL